MLGIAKTKDAPGLDAIEKNVPEPAAREALLRVKACGICGSDLRLWRWEEHLRRMMGSAIPFIIGHEFSGEIAALGPDLDGSGLNIGDAVVVEPNIACGHCWCCESGIPNLCRVAQHMAVNRDGGMAEYCAVPVECLHPLPANLSHEEGALLETLAVSVHAARQMPVQDGNVVAVVGLGPIGQLLLQVLRATTRATIIAIGSSRGQRRLRLATTMADHCLVARGDDLLKQVLGLTDGKGVDHVFETAGPGNAIVDAVEIARPGGQVCLVGAGDETPALKPFTMLRRKELTITATQGRVPADWDAVLALAASGKVNVGTIIDKRVPLAEAIDAFVPLMSDRDVIKAVVVT